jgi:hypothetical protein
MSTSIDILTSIPSHLTSEILLNWLSINEICRTDSAYCTKEKRSHLLELFGSAYFSLAENCKLSNKALVKWLLARKIRVSNIVVSSVLIKDDISDFLRFNAQNVTFVCFHNEFTSEDVNCIALYCRNLTGLSFCLWKIKQCSTGMNDLLCSNPNLECLTLQNIGFLDVFSLDGIELLKLKHLKVDAVTLDIDLLKNIRRLCTNSHFERLQLSNTKISFESSIEQLDLLNLFSTMRNLKILDLSGSSWMCDEILQKLTTCCPKIVFLDISFCARITDKGVKYIAMNLPQLHTLFIDGCDLLTERSLQYLAQYSAPRLEVLEFNPPMFRLTDVISFLQKCLHLKAVRFSGIMFYSSAQLTALFGSMPDSVITQFGRT